MSRNCILSFKIASTSLEFDQIHRLNYRTFVEEIPQHERNSEWKRIDPFHEENSYLICLRKEQLIGMVAVRARRPFSLELKMGNLERHLPPARSICEIRLLSVEKQYRHSTVFGGLVRLIHEYFQEHGHDLAIISGTVRQRRLYERLGFVPFGPLVGTSEALFQPMYLSVRSFRRRVVGTDRVPSTCVNLLPGPVDIRPDVRQAMGEAARSHRSTAFQDDFHWTKQRLCGLTGASHMEILLGSGTLANDAVAAQIARAPGRGFIPVNGEFGGRLADHATRAGLVFETLEREWGGVFDEREIERVLDRNPEIRWIWAVHCETSTGVLNDINALKAICAPRGVRLCLDCTSSIGTVPLDLAGVHLATGVSGKGLGAFPGLAMVFYHHQISPAPKSIPRYLDLGLYASSGGIPFTHSSNLLSALQTAVRDFRPEDRFEKLAVLSRWVRSKLHAIGMSIVAPDAHASPAVISITLPRETNSRRLGYFLRERGFHLSYESEYLLRRNWIQICLMGNYPRETIVPLFEILESSLLFRDRLRERSDLTVMNF